MRTITSEIAPTEMVVLAGAPSAGAAAAICMADLAGETMPRWPGKPASHGDGLVVSDTGQLMQLIALGRMAAVIGESVRREQPHACDLVVVHDAPSPEVRDGLLDHGGFC